MEALGSVFDTLGRSEDISHTFRETSPSPSSTTPSLAARYKQYYSVMAGQATMLAGFGFSALTSDIPPSTHIAAELLYMVAMGGFGTV